MSRPKQTTSVELRDELLSFLARKFYEGDPGNYAKDRPRLLKWVILWPATWLNERGITLPPAQYKAKFMEIMMLALQMGNTGKIKYRPGWLMAVIQNHFDHHGDEIYAAAKSARSLADNALAVASRLPEAETSDPTREMANAARLLKVSKRGVEQPSKISQTPDLFA